MALLKLQVEVDSKGAVTGVETFSDEFVKAGKTVDKASTKMSNSLKTVGAAVGAFLTVTAIKEFSRVTVSAFGEIEQGFIGVQKTTGLAGKEFETLQNTIEDMSTTMRGVRIDELQDIATTAGQLGIQGVENITTFTSTVSKMSVATVLGAGEASQAFAQLSNVLNEPIEKVERMGSVINELSNNSVANSRDITELSLRMGGTARTVGLTTAQIFGLSAALRDTGNEVQVAGTAMSQIFTKLLIDTEKFAKVSKVSLQDFTQTLKDEPVEALQLFLTELAKLDKFAKAEAIKSLGLEGTKAVGVVTKLTDNLDILDEQLARANKEFETGTSLQIEYETASKGIFAELTRVSNVIKLTAAGLGEDLTPLLRESVTVLEEDLIPLFSSFVGGLQEVNKALRPLNFDLKSLVEFMGDFAFFMNAGARETKKLQDPLNQLFLETQRLDERMGMLKRQLESPITPPKLKFDINLELLDLAIQRTTKLAEITELQRENSEKAEDSPTAGKRPVLDEEKKAIDELTKAQEKANITIKQLTLSKVEFARFAAGEELKVNLETLEDIELANKLHSARLFAINKQLTDKRIALEKKWKEETIKEQSDAFEEIMRLSLSTLEFEKFKVENQLLIAQEGTLKQEALALRLAQLEEQISKERLDAETTVLNKRKTEIDEFTKFQEKATLSSFNIERNNLLRQADLFVKQGRDRIKVEEAVNKELIKIRKKELTSIKKSKKKELDTVLIIEDARETAIRGVSDSIKSLWSDNAATFEDVWKNSLDVFVDVLTQMAIQAAVKGKTIQIEMAAATAGVSLLVSALSVGIATSRGGGGGQTFDERLDEIFKKFNDRFEDTLKEFAFSIANTEEKFNSLGSESLKFSNVIEDSAKNLLELEKRREELRVESFEPLPSLASARRTELRRRSQARKEVSRDIIEQSELLITGLEDMEIVIKRRYSLETELINNIGREIEDLRNKERNFVLNLENTITDVERRGFTPEQLLNAFREDVRQIESQLATTTESGTRVDLFRELKDAQLRVLNQVEEINTTDSQAFLQEQENTVNLLERIKEDGRSEFETMLDVQQDQLESLRGVRESSEALRLLGERTVDLLSLIGKIGAGEQTPEDIAELARLASDESTTAGFVSGDTNGESNKPVIFSKPTTTSTSTSTSGDGGVVTRQPVNLVLDENVLSQFIFEMSKDGRLKIDESALLDRGHI